MKVTPEQAILYKKFELTVFANGKSLQIKDKYCSLLISIMCTKADHKETSNDYLSWIRIVCPICFHYFSPRIRINVCAYQFLLPVR